MVQDYVEWAWTIMLSLQLHHVRAGELATSPDFFQLRLVRF
jgi:hypothetical protein